MEDTRRHGRAQDPKAQEGPLLSLLPQPRRLAEKALTAAIQEAYILGISTARSTTGKRDGVSGISRSQVSRLCQEIDERVKAFLERPIEGEWPYLWIDATYLKSGVSSSSSPMCMDASSETAGANNAGQQILSDDISPRAAASRAQLLRHLLNGIALAVEIRNYLVMVRNDGGLSHVTRLLRLRPSRALRGHVAGRGGWMSAKQIRSTGLSVPYT